MPARRLRSALPLALLAAGAAACGSDGATGPGPQAPGRTYAMGFTAFPPRPADTALIIRTIDLWAQRADTGLLLHEPPWEHLLRGEDAEALVRANELGLANYFRGKGLRIMATIDATNGLDRAADAPGLQALGRSLREPAVRDADVRYVGAFAAVIRPEYLSVASETNLVRAIAPAPLYDGLVDAARRAAAEARRVSPTTRVFTTIQVEVAWGRPAGPFAGVARDLADFPFTEVLGLSSFPFLGGFADPEDLPLDYYSRLVAGTSLPVMVIEGGWPSAGVGGIASSPDEQRRYIERHVRLLDGARAIGYFQITFTDLDLASIPQPPGSILPLFATLGLVDVNLAPKPALDVWDATFRRPYRP
ncbi:MAG TPA: hypothetical protein VFO85_15685 [Vicinamibacteria bacterium]|nr:hypothetical protein [Vicinamibacteria bacterium]